MKRGSGRRNWLTAAGALGAAALLSCDLALLRPAGDDGTGSLAEDGGGDGAASAEGQEEGSPGAGSPSPYRYFLYVANYSSDDLSAFELDYDSGVLSEVSGSPFLDWDSPFHPATDPDSRYLYVANTGSDIVSAYEIDPGSGALTELDDSPFYANDQPQDVLVHPGGEYLYVPNWTGTVTAYSIDPVTGALTEIAGSPFAAGTFTPAHVLIEPTGKYLYLPSMNAAQIRVYEIDSGDGSLAEITGSPFGVAEQPRDLALGPASKFIYFTRSTGTAGNHLHGYAVNTSTGEIGSAVPGSPYASPTNSYPQDLLVDPAGKFLYVGYNNAAQISAWSIDATTGALTEVSGSPFSTGTLSYPEGLVMDPDGKYLCVTGDGELMCFTANSSTGALTAAAPSVATGSLPFGIEMAIVPR